MLRFRTPVQLPHHKPVLPDSDISGSSLRWYGLRNVQDDVGLHEGVSFGANIGPDDVYLH